MKKLTYTHTMYACFIGYIIQAIVNNFIPLLFITFESQFNISLSSIAMLVSINFAIQLCVDFLAVYIIDKIGYRRLTVLSHILSAAGLIMLAFLPNLLPNPYLGILLSIVFYAIGGGLLEVLISPIVEACPTDNKSKAMSLLHSFYCWGQVGVVLISTAFFMLFGIENWHIMALIWAIIPILNSIIFLKTPISELGKGEKPLKLKSLFTNKTFLFFVILMFCSGASEMAVGQWASAFAEKSLHVTKAVGDLAGPMAFAAFMGLARTVYGKYGEKINLNRFMLLSSILTVCSYLIIAFVPNPIIGLMGCMIAGFSVGIMWPGTYSLCAASIKGANGAIFALLALAGDLGCTLAPALVGTIAEMFADNIRIGIFAATVFPFLFLLSLVFKKKTSK